MRTVAFCEIEPFARGVLAKHWPDVPCDGDITAREFTEGEADVICGGFPCQDISTAGNGAGLAGERSGLWRELLRAIRVVRPRYAVVENVAALLSRGMGTVLGDLAQIGYDAEWHCIPASSVGAPHRRDRVWIVADPGSQQYEGGRAPLSGKIATELFSSAMADADDQRKLQSQGRERNERGWFGDRGQDVAHAERFGCHEMAEPIACRASGEGTADPIKHSGFAGRREWWATEPDVGRVAHGISSRVDRLKGLGNAVVPQIPEIIGRAIMSAALSSQQGKTP